MSHSNSQDKKIKIPTPSENWTKYPNFILDNIEHFTGNEFKILSLMVRKILGFSSPNLKFSKSYIAIKTGITKKTVIKSIDNLKDMGLIHEVKKDKTGTICYDLSWQEPTFKINRSVKITLPKKKTTSVKITPPASVKITPPDRDLLVEKLHPLKETITTRKETREKETKNSPLSIVENYYSFLDLKGIKYKKSKLDNRITGQVPIDGLDELLDELTITAEKLNQLNLVRSSLNEFQLTQSGAGEPDFNILSLFNKREKIKSVYAGLKDNLKIKKVVT